jgi:MoxR-like ATPase
MFMIFVDYPSAPEEIEIMKRGTGIGGGTPRAIFDVEHIIYLQGTVKRMPAADHIFHYAQKIAAATRAKSPQALDFCQRWLAWGAGPRTPSCEARCMSVAKTSRPSRRRSCGIG